VHVAKVTSTRSRQHRHRVVTSTRSGRIVSRSSVGRRRPLLASVAHAAWPELVRSDIILSLSSSSPSSQSSSLSSKKEEEEQQLEDE